MLSVEEDAEALEIPFDPELDEIFLAAFPPSLPILPSSPTLSTLPLLPILPPQPLLPAPMAAPPPQDFGSHRHLAAQPCALNCHYGFGTKGQHNYIMPPERKVDSAGCQPFGSPQNPFASSEGFVSSLHYSEDAASRESSLCFTSVSAFGGQQWPTRKSMTLQPYHLQGRDDAALREDSLCSPFAADLVQTASPESLPMTHPQRQMSNMSSNLRTVDTCGSRESMASGDQEATGFLHRHSAPPLMDGAYNDASAEWRSEPALRYSKTLPEKEVAQILPGLDASCQSLPSSPQAVKRGRRVACSQANLQKKSRKSRKGVSVPKGKDHGDSFQFWPRSPSDTLRIVSGKGNFEFPAWRPHDDKPTGRKLCLKIRSNQYSNQICSGPFKAELPTRSVSVKSEVGLK